MRPVRRFLFMCRILQMKRAARAAAPQKLGVFPRQPGSGFQKSPWRWHPSPAGRRNLPHFFLDVLPVPAFQLRQVYHIAPPPAPFAIASFVSSMHCPKGKLTAGSTSTGETSSSLRQKQPQHCSRLDLKAEVLCRLAVDLQVIESGELL